MGLDAVGAWLLLVALDLPSATGDARPWVEIRIVVARALRSFLDAIVGAVGAVEDVVGHVDATSAGCSFGRSQLHDSVDLERRKDEDEKGQS